MEQTAATPENPTKMTLQAGYIMPKMSGDMRFVGMISIIYGALSSITIIGAVFGIPMIFAGLRLREAADYFTNFSKNSDPILLQNAFERQSRFFNIIKVLIIISLIFFVAYILVMIIFGGYFLSQFLNGTDLPWA
ncbi:DUF5362 domain-containing protein [bacterium]|nr:DUF5362 domain-containing protein [bacterium]